MEEGKRMFSIFAARMFEQRVLQAYREKVAQERQLQLLRELDDEDKITKDREMKRQNQNQKKKDKKRYVMLLFYFTFKKGLKGGFCDSRQQKQAKEEERALKAADKAAEEAAARAKQAALDEESRKKREDERLKREAAKKAMDEEKARKDEDRRKRAQEEREREQERERKKKEKEDKMRKEREERERKAKEEREARLAKEKEEKAEKDRVEKEKREEREKVEKEKKAAKEKAEKEAKEKLAAQQRSTAAASASTLSSGSGKGSARANNAVASSSTPTTPVKSNSSSTSSVAAPALQRLPNNSGSNGNDTPSKKPANKSIPALVTSPLPPGILGQGTRPAVQQPNLSRPSHLPSPTPINPQQPHLPQPPHSAGMMYGHPQGPVGMISPSTMSPRIGNFPPMAYGYGGPNMQQQHPPPLSPVPARGFNGGSFDPTFNRGMPIGVGVPLGALPPLPIGPPTKAAKSAAQGTVTSTGLAPGQGRHASASSNDASGPGPITRPMAPIARPTAGGGNGPGEAASSGSGSPNCRSPSPSRVLGSSALAADDDEVVSAHGPRRAATIGIGTLPIGGGPGGQNWGSASPRTALSEANLRGGPWTASAFSSPRTAIGPNNHLHQLHHPGPSLWGNTPGNGNGENWHAQSPGFFSQAVHKS